MQVRPDQTSIAYEYYFHAGLRFTLEHNLSQARALRSHDLDLMQTETQF